MRAAVGAIGLPEKLSADHEGEWRIAHLCCMHRAAGGRLLHPRCRRQAPMRKLPAVFGGICLTRRNRVAARCRAAHDTGRGYCGHQDDFGARNLGNSEALLRKIRLCCLPRRSHDGDGHGRGSSQNIRDLKGPSSPRRAYPNKPRSGCPSAAAPDAGSNKSVPTPDANYESK